MPKESLLTMVQSILSDMESDEVNSINDTIEATQVASIIKDTFFEISNSRLWPTNDSIIQLISLSSSTRPTHLRLSDNVHNISWIKYDKRAAEGDAKRYQEVNYREPAAFLEVLLSRDSLDTTVQTVTDLTNIPLLIKNDAAPTYWTTFDDEYIIFDSFDSGVDSTIQTSKTMASVVVEPTFSIVDAFIPDLPAKAFPYLLAEAKSNCFEKLKQAPSAKEEQKSRRQRTFLSQEKWRNNRGPKYAGFGRK
jgi:hypothetical protein